MVANIDGVVSTRASDQALHILPGWPFGQALPCIKPRRLNRSGEA
jgi:hypothetical protein